MRTLSINNYNSKNHKINSKSVSDNPISYVNLQAGFIKSDIVSFRSSTSNGNVLKKLKDITCPYTGIKMITGSMLAQIEGKLDKANTAKKAVTVLKKYKKYMQPTEKIIFEKFENYAKTSPDGNFQECLKQLYGESFTKLQLEEFYVLDDVDKISAKLSPKTELEIRKKTTRCREVILANNPGDTFKRKTLLSSLEEVKPQKDELNILEELKDRAIYLPTSGSSENAFVVKYAPRTHNEIAKRLIRVSLATIEHIVPDSLGGGNILSNFMLASASANNARSNMPLTKFIDMHPNIPKNCQKYINEIIGAIKSGKLKRHDSYPFDLKETLKDASNGRIVLDLSDYKIKK